MSPMPSPPPIKRDPLRIEICRDADDLARHAAQSFVNIAGMALGSRGRFDVALAAGEAARRMYAVLAEEHFAFQIVWPAVNVSWSDEIGAPGGERQQVESFLAKVGAAGNIQPLRGKDGEAIPMDLIVLDLRDMGAPAPGIIRDARCVMVLASGESVASAAQRMLGADGQESGRAQALRPANGQLLWLLDAEAASRLALPETDGAPGGTAPGSTRPDEASRDVPASESDRIPGTGR